MDLQPNKETLAGCPAEFNAAPKYRQVTATARVGSGTVQRIKREAA
jgi:hypothetical protein